MGASVRESCYDSMTFDPDRNRQQADKNLGWRSMPGHQITFLTAALLLGSGLFVAGSARAGNAAVTVELQLRFVDADLAPLAKMPLRLRVGTGIDRQAGSAAATTDAAGRVRTTVQVALGQRARAMPTNVVGSVFATMQKTTWLQVGVELPPFPGGNDSPCCGRSTSIVSPTAASSCRMSSASGPRSPTADSRNPCAGKDRPRAPCCPTVDA
jgi:hypothetical protein